MTDADTSNPSILSHISIGTRDFERSTRFYDAVLATLGCRRIMEHPGAVAYGRAYPEFWVQLPIDGKPASIAYARLCGISINVTTTAANRSFDSVARL